MLPSNGGTPWRARPATTGNFPSQTQGDCGTDGTFPLLPPWETKGSYFKILSPFQHVGGPEAVKASPKRRNKDTSQQGARTGVAGCCPAPGTTMGKVHWSGSEDTQGQNNKVTCKENTAWSWGKMARASPGRRRVRTLEQRGVLLPHGPHSPSPSPPARTLGQSQSVTAFAPRLQFLLCILSVKCIFQT